MSAVAQHRLSGAHSDCMFRPVHGSSYAVRRVEPLVAWHVFADEPGPDVAVMASHDSVGRPNRRDLSSIPNTPRYEGKRIDGMIALARRGGLESGVGVFGPEFRDQTRHG